MSSVAVPNEQSLVIRHSKWRGLLVRVFALALLQPREELPTATGP